MLSVAAHITALCSSAGHRLRTHSPLTFTQSPKNEHWRVSSPL